MQRPGPKRRSWRSRAAQTRSCTAADDSPEVLTGGQYADGSGELYNERNDPYEWTNLAKDRTHDNVKSELARALPQVNKPAPKASKPITAGGQR